MVSPCLALTLPNINWLVNYTGVKLISGYSIYFYFTLIKKNKDLESTSGLLLQKLLMMNLQ